MSEYNSNTDCVITLTWLMSNGERRYGRMKDIKHSDYVILMEDGTYQTIPIKCCRTHSIEFIERPPNTNIGKVIW